VKKYNRQELYEKIWQFPMSHVAKEYGFSGSFLTRVCDDLDIPRPPRGFTSNMSDKNRSRVVRPPLPSNFAYDLLDEYDERDKNESFKFDPLDFSQPVPDPPTLKESIEDFQERIVSKLPVIRLIKNLNNPHPNTYRLIKENDERRKEYKKNGYGDEPIFDGKDGELALRAYDTLFKAWTKLGYKMQMSGRTHFQFTLLFNKMSRPFKWLIKKPFKYLNTSNSIAKTHYGFLWTYDTWDYERTQRYKKYFDITDELIQELIVDSVVFWERKHREWIVSQYEWNVHSRDRALKEAAEKVRKEAERKERERKELIEKRDELMLDALARMTYSDQIRDLVEKLESKSNLGKTKIVGFEKWKRWALYQAQYADPREMSIKHAGDWIKKFKLKQ